MIMVQEQRLAEQQRQDDINNGKASLTGTFTVTAAYTLAAIFAWTTHELQVESCTKSTLSFLKITDAFVVGFW